MHANELALGRNHATCDRLSVTHFGGFDPCWRVDLCWDDGAHVSALYDSENEAKTHAYRLGFSPTQTGEE